MLTSWWGKALTWGYLGGYWLYVLVAAVVAWPQMSFAAWSVQVLLYQMTVAMVWPVLLPLKWMAGHW